MRPTTPAQVHAWLGQLKDLSFTGSCEAPEFIRPFHFVTLALAISGRNPQSLSMPATIRNYAARMHLWEAVGLPSPVSVNERDASGKFVPIEPLRSRDAISDCCNKVMDVTKHTSLGPEDRESLKIVLSELMDNCFSHAAITGSLHGLACAQYWPKGKLLQVAIADAGIGIRSSLNNADSEEIRERSRVENCCSLATELHVSSQINNGHAGYGLALGSQITSQNGGTFGVYSGDEWHHSELGSTSSGKLNSTWRGTLIIAEFNTTANISANAIYRTWPPVRGYSNDDFDFDI